MTTMNSFFETNQTKCTKIIIEMKIVFGESKLLYDDFCGFFQEKLLAGGHTFSIDDAASNDDHYADGKMVKFLKMAVEPEKREIKRKKVDSSEKFFFSFLFSL